MPVQFFICVGLPNVASLPGFAALQEEEKNFVNRVATVGNMIRKARQLRGEVSTS